MNFTTLYGKSSGGSLLIWEVSTQGDTITVRHGQLGGKIQERKTVCKTKSKGKSNETTPEEQAVLEAKAKHVKQQKKGYYETKEEALEHVEFTPMKLQAWKDHASKITYPCFYQTKLNGMRYMVQKDGSGLSKQGEEIFLPTHIQQDVDIIAVDLGDRFKGFDGEVYAGNMHRGGLSLQKIISAFRKENEDTEKLKYYIYNIPDSTETFQQRVESMKEIEQIIIDYDIQNVVVLETMYCLGEDDADKFYEIDVNRKEEGGVYHNARGIYEFGKRSYDSQKRKPRQSAEAKVMKTEIDKNGQGLLTCQMENGVEFKCLMLKDADPTQNLRMFEESKQLIGLHIEFEYEELSDDGVPTKAVGHRVRKVNSITGEGE